MNEAKAASLRAFGKRIGVSHVAVSKAITTGRLPDAVVGRRADGKPFVADIEAAELAWRANASRLTKPELAELAARENIGLSPERVFVYPPFGGLSTFTLAILPMGAEDTDDEENWLRFPLRRDTACELASALAVHFGADDAGA